MTDNGIIVHTMDKLWASGVSIVRWTRT